ncbi:MAG TPA: ABC transporter permease [Actinomycetota bacterium]|nr:ABC transporter permease [Actinomycetota bacterium]
MSAIPVAGVHQRVSLRRARLTGGFFILLALVMVFAFAANSEPGQESVFVLNAGEVAIPLPAWALPTQASLFVMAGLCALAGVVQATRGFGRYMHLVLGAVVSLFIFSFLVWADRDQSINLMGMLAATLLSAVPLTLGACSGILCERSAVINISIEGMMITAAFTGAVVASAAGSLWIGMVLGILSGALLGGILAVLAIRYQVDQIIAGTVINIFALGITSYLSARVLAQYSELNNPGVFGTWPVPLLSEIPILGPIFFTANVFVYVMYAVIAVLTVALFKTRWGLRVRAVGEHPRAADTVGINPLRTRYVNVLLGGMMAGLAGAYFTLGSVGRFEENMTAGNGFIALAAMIFGRWHPVGAFGAALVFGFAQALQSKVALLHVPISSDFLLMAPYIATILVVAGVVGRARPPAADGQPYVKE